MRFTKMQGLGNDFIVVTGAEAEALDWPALATRLCDRRRGIGADGVLLLGASARADLRMRLVNAGGDEAEMCGNGVRCAAVLAAARGLCGPRVVWETGAGLITTELRGDGMVTVDMGPPRFAPAAIPVLADGGEALGIELAVDLGGGDALTVVADAVGMGNPHCVVRLDALPASVSPGGRLDDVDLHRLGPALEAHPRFPRRTNVEVVAVEARDRLRQRTHERGVGETEACGTGACAAVVAMRCRGLVDERVEVALRGGTLRIEWADAGPVLMTGPAVAVFEGTVAAGALAAP